MRATMRTEMDPQIALCVSRETLAQMLGCGQAAADKVAKAAEARIRIGKRVVIKVDKVKAYLERIAE